jgi:hypothetical protein
MKPRCGLNILPGPQHLLTHSKQCAYARPCTMCLLLPLLPCMQHCHRLCADFKLQLQHVAAVGTSTHTLSPLLLFVCFCWLLVLTDDFPPPQTPPLHSYMVQTHQVPLQHVKDKSWQIEPICFGADCCLQWVQPLLWIENNITSPPLDPLPLVISLSFPFTTWSALKMHDHHWTDIAQPYYATASTFQVYYALLSCNHV